MQQEKNKNVERSALPYWISNKANNVPWMSIMDRRRRGSNCNHATGVCVCVQCLLYFFNLHAKLIGNLMPKSITHCIEKNVVVNFYYLSVVSFLKVPDRWFHGANMVWHLLFLQNSSANFGVDHWWFRKFTLQASLDTRSHKWRQSRSSVGKTDSKTKCALFRNLW